MTVLTDTLPDRYHNAMLEWQRKHFDDYPYLLEHWPQFYRVDPFRLVAKLSDLKKETIAVGRHAGRQVFETAAQMDGEMAVQCLKLIRAQASTELGSIQQHRVTLHRAADPEIQFDILRIMAEEFRHGYQMIYLLAKEEWPGENRDVARDTIEELLAMRTGTHVLDAFNVYFDSFVDNVVFAALIDRVGKYQLTMQSVSAYAPISRSMGPMLIEEAFHLTSGVTPLRAWVAQAAVGKGNVSLGNIQRHINKWLPRGLEMFGDERGGKTNVEWGFKDLLNGEAAARYHREVGHQVVDVLNQALVQARLPRLSLKEAAALAAEVSRTGQAKEGIQPEELFVLPSEKFYRRRGVHAFQMYDVQGHPVSSLDEYLAHLKTVLPEAYITGKDFSTYVANLTKARGGEEVAEGPLPFYG